MTPLEAAVHKAEQLGIDASAVREIINTYDSNRLDGYYLIPTQCGYKFRRVDGSVDSTVVSGKPE